MAELSVRQQLSTRPYNGTAENQTPGSPPLQRTLAPRGHHQTLRLPPRKTTTFPTIKACIRWNRGNCHSAMWRFAHECLVFQSAFDSAKDCPILQPNTANPPSFGADKDTEQ